MVAFLVVALFMLFAFFKEMPGVLRTFDSSRMFALFGNSLVLWTVMELVQAEYNVLCGRSFDISVLIDVALATVVRKLLVSDFAGGTQLTYDLISLGTLAVVRFIFMGNHGQLLLKKRSSNGEPH